MFSVAVEQALAVAITAHDGQLRRGTHAPYSVHPIHMALFLTRQGLDDTVVVAALLHDVVEDCEEWDLDLLAEQFGERVASIVSELTEDKSKRWRERKEAGIAAVAGMSTEAVAIKAADKLHNLSSLCVSLETAQDPERVWGQFRGGREGTLEIAERMVKALEERADPRMARELRAVLDRLLEWGRPAADPSAKV